MKDKIEILENFIRWRRGADVPHPSTIEAGKAIDELIAELKMRRRGECICKKCGLRQDDSYPKGDF